MSKRTRNILQSIPAATKGFYYTSPEEKQKEITQVQKESYDVQEKLNIERIKEVKTKHKTRQLLTTAFILLLFLQNIIVFFIVYQAFMANKLKDLELIFTALTGATLTETYFVIKIIVNYMFKDEDYMYKKPAQTAS